MAGQPGTSSDTADFRILSRMLDLINRERQRAGAAPLALSTQLCQAAQAHSRDMAERSYFSDTSPEGVDVAERVRRTGYKGKSAANLAMGPERPEEMMPTMMDDPTSRATLLDAKHQHLGVGLHEGAWTVVFASPFGAATGPDLETANALLEVVNRERGRLQRFPLRLSEQLNAAAHAHATDMYQRSYVGSRSPDGTGVSDRARSAGFDGRVGSSVAAGVASAQQAVELWLKDEANRNNLLGGEYRYLGGAAVHNRWVVVLGTPPLAANATQDLIGATLELVNRQRERNQQFREAKPLALSEFLNEAAQAHARDMLARGYLGARGQDGTGIAECIERSGYKGTVSVSFASGPVTPEAAVDGWMKNADDRLNLLSPKVTEMGVGVLESRWVIIFAKPSDEAANYTPQLVTAMLEAINTARAKALVPPLTINDRLAEAAQAHAVDMAQRDFNGSVNPDGVGPAQRVQRVKYPYRSLIEFTAVDQPSAQKVVEMWMQSPNRAHLLHKDLVHAGIGVDHSRWAVLLARPQ